MEKLSKFTKYNWPYLVMLIFILAMSFMIIAGNKADPGHKIEEDTRYKIDVLDKTKFAEKQARLEDVVKENPILYLLLIAANIFIFLVVFGGVFLNITYIYHIRHGKDLLKRTVENESVKWNIGDVVRFAVMFYSFGYLFIFLQSRLIRVFPILNSNNFRLIFNASVMDIVGICFVLNFVVVIYRQALTTAGLTMRNFLRNVFYGIAGYVACVPLLVITLMATAIVISVFKLRPPVQPIVDLMIKEDKVDILVFSAIFAAIAGPIMEEVFFRGFMYNAVKKKIGVRGGIIITAGVFSVLHAHAVGFLPILILGVILTYLYEKTGSLIPSMTLHILHNLLSLCMVFFVRGFNL